MINIAVTVNPYDQTPSVGGQRGAGEAWLTGREADLSEITALLYANAGSCWRRFRWVG